MLKGTMWRKGLLEWKLLAAVFAVLIVASSALIGDTNLSKVFFNSTESGSGWTNPFGSLFERQAAVEDSNAIVIELTLENISFGFESPVNITSGRSEMEGFSGVAAFDFRDNSSYYAQSQGMVIRKDIDSTQIRGAVLKDIVLESADYVVESGGTNITGKGERIEIHDFSGTVMVSDRVRLDGTVSSVKDGKWSIG